MNPYAVIAALADPTRFAVLERLATGGVASASALAREFPVSRQAIAKHLAALLDAALVRPVRQGRELTYLATPQPLLDTGAWLAARAGAWDAHRRDQGAR